MINNLIEKLNLLRLKTCSENISQALDTAAQKNWSTLQVLDYLADLELERRRSSKISLLYKKSKLGDKFTLDQFDFNHHASRKKNKNLMQNMLHLDFLACKKDIILIGNPGVGKTFFAKCIAYQATQRAVRTLFTTAIDMINHLITAEADNSLLKKLDYYQSPDLLVIDEVGYLPLGAQGSNLFFQVISARHEKKSTIITTNLPFANWGTIFDSTTVATAIADRLVNNSEVFILEGKSYRKRKN